MVRSIDEDNERRGPGLKCINLQANLTPSRYAYFIPSYSDKCLIIPVCDAVSFISPLGPDSIHSHLHLNEMYARSSLHWITDLSRLESKGLCLKFQLHVTPSKETPGRKVSYTTMGQG